jgi:hypothetical protein
MFVFCKLAVQLVDHASIIYPSPPSIYSLVLESSPSDFFADSYLVIYRTLAHFSCLTLTITLRNIDVVVEVPASEEVEMGQ